MTVHKMLGEILVEELGVQAQEIEKALKFQAEYGGRLGLVLINSGIITEGQLLQALSRQIGVPLLRDYLKETDGLILFPEVPGLPAAWLAEHGAVPVMEDERRLAVVVLDPVDAFLREVLEEALGGTAVEYLLATEKEFRDLEAEYRRKHAVGETVFAYEMEEVEKLKDLASEAPIIKFVNTTIAKAIEGRASDIHFETTQDNYRVRFRIDGVLADREFLPLHLQPAVTTRIKILAGMDIAEKRLPQDGRINLKVAAKDLDIRVATFPTIYGENIVMRLLEKSTIDFSLGALGFGDDHLDVFNRLIHSPFGLLLITGPTGSGKTTTLYSALNSINSKDKKIITIEDPVEYQLRGVNQIQVKPAIGLTFAGALRSILRQDPDIILVGEIRDKETAEIAIQAALTGHLVLSTLHTNDAPSAVTRLLDMGIDDFLINASLMAVLAQRLVRRVCSRCRIEAPPREYGPESEPALRELTLRFGIERRIVQPGPGCEECLGTSYRGRVGVFELMEYTDAVKQATLRHHDYRSLKAEAAAQGMRTLRDDGFLKAFRGQTTIEEVLRVT